MSRASYAFLSTAFRLSPILSDLSDRFCRGTGGTGRTIILPFPPPVRGQTAHVPMVLLVLLVLLRLLSRGGLRSRQRRAISSFISHHSSFGAAQRAPKKLHKYTITINITRVSSFCIPRKRKNLQKRKKSCSLRDFRRKKGGGRTGRTSRTGGTKKTSLALRRTLVCYLLTNAGSYMSSPCTSIGAGVRVLVTP